MTGKAVLGELCGGLTVFIYLFIYLFICMHLQAVFGELSGGLAIETSAGYARSLLLPESPIVNCLGKSTGDRCLCLLFARV